MVDTGRDSKGRFVNGHKSLSGRDGGTGRFIAKSFLSVEDQVDLFLNSMKKDG